jgi:2-hydroxychromene-2-carboxylate isomerase
MGRPRLPDLRSEATGPIAVWQRQDLVERAAALGVAIKNPAMPSSESTSALRAAMHAVAAGKAEAFVARVMQGCWGEGADIAEPALLAAWGAEIGLGGIIEATSDSSRVAELDARLHANLAEAIAAGVFDLPASVIDGRIYFGVERLDLLERHLFATATSPGS